MINPSKNICITLLCGFTTFSSAVAMSNDDVITTQQYVQQARQLTKSYAIALKNTLKPALKAKGPSGALKACNLSAPAIKKNINSQGQWSVSRTSLKVRNSTNAPSGWEREILLRFDAQNRQGIALNTLEHSAIVERDGKRYFKYMKAIPTAQKPCLACHGSDIDPKLSHDIKLLYPGDSAIGYKAGELRGAFSLTRVYNEN